MNKLDIWKEERDKIYCIRMGWNIILTEYLISTNKLLLIKIIINY